METMTMTYRTNKPIQDYKHTSSVSVLVFQEIATGEIAGKVIANHSDGGVVTAKAFWTHGKFSEGKHYEIGFKKVSVGGSGYDKLNACLADMFAPHFDTYAEVADLDAGILHGWFNSHGYRVHEIL